MGGRRLPDGGHYAKVTNGMHIFMKAESFVQGVFAGPDGLGIEQEALYTPMGGQEHLLK